MICYAANFEDVILQRVFRDVAKGFYLDVGASAPVQDNNTFAFYQKGWRGVAVEPLPYQKSWLSTRPEDVLITAAVGNSCGALTLQIYDQAQQISSGSASTQCNWKNSGVTPSRQIQVPMVTLDEIIRVHFRGKPLHLMSIDVEGMELEALQGLNLQSSRPWVIVVESVIPGSQTPAHQTWEPLLLGANYIMAYFDGLNRFYLAHEQRSLLPHFALPPNIWDGFVTAQQLALQSQVEKLKGQLSSLHSMSA